MKTKTTLRTSESVRAFLRGVGSIIDIFGVSSLDVQVCQTERRVENPFMKDMDKLREDSRRAWRRI